MLHHSKQYIQLRWIVIVTINSVSLTLYINSCVLYWDSLIFNIINSVIMFPKSLGNEKEKDYNNNSHNPDSTEWKKKGEFLTFFLFSAYLRLPGFRNSSISPLSKKYQTNGCLCCYLYLWNKLQIVWPRLFCLSVANQIAQISETFGSCKNRHFQV